MRIPEVKRPPEEVLAKVQSLKGKKGMIVAIEPETGDWFLGKNVLEALKRGREKYPQGIFYFVRVGYPSAHAHKGGDKTRMGFLLSAKMGTSLLRWIQDSVVGLLSPKKFWRRWE